MCSSARRSPTPSRYADIITVGAQGYGTQSHGPVPAGVFPWSADVPQYTQDLDEGQGPAAQAGYPNGGFSLNLTYAAENQNEARFAPLIKEAYATLGVNVTLTPIAFNQQWEKAKATAGRQDMFLLLYWPTYADAGSDNLWSMFHSSDKPFFNLSYWKNTQFDTLVDDAIGLTATQRDQAQAKYVQAMKLLVDQAPGVFLRHSLRHGDPQARAWVRVQPELPVRPVLLPDAPRLLSPTERGCRTHPGRAARPPGLLT